MTIDAITSVLTPPSSPIEIPIAQTEWQAIEKTLGTELPSDYKEFISTFGTGCIDRFFWVFNPFSKNRNLNLVSQLRPIFNGLIIHMESGEKIDYPFFPEPGGLLPWGATDNGDTFYWVWENSSPRWRIVGHDSEVVSWLNLDVYVTEFIAKILSRQIIVDFFPDDFPSASPKFVAVPPRAC